MKNRPRLNRRGFALVLALLTSSISLILMIAYISRVVADHKFTAKIYNSTLALDIAEAGAERALWEVGYNSMTFSGWTTAIDGSGNIIRSISVDSFQDSSGKNMGSYYVSVTVSADGMNATATATGYVPSKISPDSTRTVRVTCARHNFGKAVIGLNGVTMSGQAYTDSYNSTLGSYSSQPHTQNGDIASNGAISLSGQARVNGDANPGADYPFSGTPNVSGSYGTLQAPIVVDPIPQATLAAAMASNNNSNIIKGDVNDPSPLNGYDLSVSGPKTITLPGGTYYFTSISIGSQAVMNITGPCTIYVDGGTIVITGQGIVNTGQPRNLLLYSTGLSINLAGQAAFAGAIYAPSATVTLTGQEKLYGSIICGSNLDSGQAAIHYDMDLLNVTPVFANNRVTSWQEINQ